MSAIKFLPPPSEAADPMTLDELRARVDELFRGTKAYRAVQFAETTWSDGTTKTEYVVHADSVCGTGKTPQEAWDRWQLNHDAGLVKRRWLAQMPSTGTMGVEHLRLGVVA